MESYKLKNLVWSNYIETRNNGNNADILQATINHFNSDKIDFFVHWDKKWAQPTLCAKGSQIIMIENPLRVQWGTDSQIRL